MHSFPVPPHLTILLLFPVHGAIPKRWALDMALSPTLVTYCSPEVSVFQERHSPGSKSCYSAPTCILISDTYKSSSFYYNLCCCSSSSSFLPVASSFFSSRYLKSVRSQNRTMEAISLFINTTPTTYTHTPLFCSINQTEDNFGPYA